MMIMAMVNITIIIMFNIMILLMVNTMIMMVMVNIMVNDHNRGPMINKHVPGQSIS